MFLEEERGWGERRWRTYQVITWADEEPTARKERKGKIIVTLEVGLAVWTQL